MVLSSKNQLGRILPRQTLVGPKNQSFPTKRDGLGQENQLFPKKIRKNNPLESGHIVSPKHFFSVRPVGFWFQDHPFLGETIFFPSNVGISLQDQRESEREGERVCVFHLLFARFTN